MLTKLLFAASLAVLASCNAPGEGKAAQAGKSLGGEVIAGLERFRADHGHYPEALAELHPVYVRTPLKESGHGDTDGISFDYAPQSDGSYVLAFRYFGPGVNDCTLQPMSHPPQWKCSGHY